jgi:histidine ammonia-lyase
MMPESALAIGDTLLDFDSMCQYMQQPLPLVLTAQAIQKIENCRQYLDKKTGDAQARYYGINTGFGYLQDVGIDASQLRQLQVNLLRSHACGMGQPVPNEIVRLMLMLKVKSLCYGHSGVQLATVQRLVDMHNSGLLPLVFTQGSLGASGDLAPLSHLSLPLIGEGELIWEGKRTAAATVLQQLGWPVLQLHSKEGLALINGTQFMRAYGIYCLQKAQRLLQWADAIAALSFDAFNCSLSPLHPLVHKIRPHAGQVHTAQQLLQFLEGSELANASKKAVQDPYSFRCAPQVHGASKDTFAYVQSVFMTEVNAVTDNPNIFPDEDEIVSGGNFHGQPLALALDFLSIALSEIGNISERRTYQLISGQRDLPLFLVQDAGLNSGLMIPQYTAAGLVSENKQLCTPASVDSISSSNNQEDHVSMGANAATQCKSVMDNVEKILAIEWLTACQAIAFRRPGKTSPFLEKLVDSFRQKVSFNTADRLLHYDMMEAVAFIGNNLPTLP